MNTPHTLPVTQPDAFHQGEQALQARVGSRATLAALGHRILREAMPEQHRRFFAQLPFLVAGLVGDDGQPWATVLAAPPGFVQSPDERHLHVAALPLPGDPAAAALRGGAPIGLLGIEPHTRRRNRANGIVEGVDGDGFSLRIQQSFGNCPKYIWPREATYVARTGTGESGGRAGHGEPGEPGAPGEHAEHLDADAMRFIAQADTFFIATAHPDARRGDGARAHGVDVSHRGGPRGFVRVVDARRLVVPDYVGNAFFNTLGNLLLNPRAGLLFIDYDNGDLLYLAAKVAIVQDGNALDDFPGAQRLLALEVDAMHRLPSALPLRWGEPASLPLTP